MAKRFTAIIIIANIIMGLLIILASSIVLFDLSGKPQVIVTGFNFFSIYLAYAQGSSVVPAIAWSIPNLPFYVFLLSLVVNFFFMIKLLRNKETKPNNL